MNKIPVARDTFFPAIENINKNQMSFVDSLTLQIMKRNEIHEICSNDKEFDRIGWVKRLWE